MVSLIMHKLCIVLTEIEEFRCRSVKVPESVSSWLKLQIRSDMFTNTIHIAASGKLCT